MTFSSLMTFAGKRMRVISRLLLFAALLLLTLGGFWGLWFSPPDWRQGEAVRIMYVHVPSAWMSLFCWFVLALLGVALLLNRINRNVASRKYLATAFVATANAGFWFTALTLATGSIWGRAIWGLWWAWDARLTAELILLFLYAAVLALLSAFNSEWRGLRAASFLAIFGLLHLPVIKFSVEWWISLHQSSSVFASPGERLPADFLLPLMVMGLAYLVLFASLVALRLESTLTKATLSGKGS
ncbi:MAG: cytochrome c biogenesis protein CcsA [Alphaproteobacteria bacterium]